MRATVAQLMTRDPYTVRSDQPAEIAGRLMQAHGIHHLPVVDDEVLVGLLNERDLRLAIAHVGPARGVVVAEAMSREPLVVGPESPLAPVAALMADHRVDSAVVMSGGKVVGILCAFDALHALARMTATRQLTPSSDATTSASSRRRTGW